MAVRRSRNYWAYKNKQRRRHRFSTAVHEARWGKALAALCICLATFFIVLAMGPLRDSTGGTAQAVQDPPAGNVNAQSPEPEPQQMGLALLGDEIQQQLDAIETELPQPEETASPTLPPDYKTPDEDVMDVDVPVISHAPKEGATPAVALTFDDGPSFTDTTSQLLDALKQHNIKATFFTLGNKSPGTDSTLQRIIDEGHEVGSHTYNHLNLRELSDEEQFYELNENEKLIEKYGGNVRYIRTPYGKYDKRVLLYASEHDCILVAWNIDTEDWKYKADPNGARIIADHVLDTVKDGDIILMHDIHQNSVDAAIILMDELKARGFEMVTVHDLINR